MTDPQRADSQRSDPANNSGSALSAVSFKQVLPGIVPFIVIIAIWYICANYLDIPPYKLPPIGQVLTRTFNMVADGSLLEHSWESLKRLMMGFVIGNGLAIPLGFAIALNRHVSDLFRPILTFFQSIAGIAWVPLAVVWFGVGVAPVVFVIANTIFFSSIYNVVTGVEAIPRTLRRAVRSHGGSGLQFYVELIFPGALIHILLGLRTSVSYGLRAMIGAELIAGSDGLGFLIIDATHTFATDIVFMGMIIIALLWLALDHWVFRPLERRTVVRWGLMHH